MRNINMKLSKASELLKSEGCSNLIVFVFVSVKQCTEGRLGIFGGTVLFTIQRLGFTVILD